MANITSRTRRIGAGCGLAAALALLGGCYDDGYGYGGVSAGYGVGGYYDDSYYDSGYYGAGYGGYGWYDGFYYPGTGFYVFDRAGGRHRWNDRQRTYWAQRHDGGAGGGFAGDPRGRDGRPDRDGTRPRIRPDGARHDDAFAGRRYDRANGIRTGDGMQRGFTGRPDRGFRADGAAPQRPAGADFGAQQQQRSFGGDRQPAGAGATPQPGFRGGYGGGRGARHRGE